MVFSLTRGALALSGALVALSGCASLPAQPPRGDAANCRALFQRYDQAVSLFQPYSYNEDGSPQTPAISRAGTSIIAGGCLTTSQDIKGIEALQMRLGIRKPVESGAAIKPTAVHVGILTSFTDAGRAIGFFESQGYDTRTIGAEKLGRRLYIGPVRTQGGLDQAIALAAEAGFPSAYPSELFQFWKY
jgi:hypothetical protein